jgi:hypothetical protein
MDHSYIEAHNIIAQYEMGKLSSTDRALFEEHFVDCADCQEQLGAAEDFRQGLKTAVAEDAAAARLQPKSSWFAWLAPGGWRPALLGATAIVIGLLPTIVLLRVMRQVEGELGRTKTAEETWQRRYAEEQHARVGLEQRLHEVETQVQQNSDAAARVPVVASIFPLNVVRSGDTNGVADNLKIPRALQWVVFSLDLEDGPRSRSYDVALSDADSRVVWKQDHLAPGKVNTLGIGVPSELLREGDYVLTLKGFSSQGGAAISRTYSFHIKLAK